MRTGVSAAFWDRTLRLCDDPEWWSIITTSLMPSCESLRPPDDKSARRGTMSEASCACLFALSSRLLPRVTVEIGTFIGTSARVLAIRSEHVYTCDDRHDLVKGRENLTTYPFTSSTLMLADLVRKGLAVDLFFFDGEIQPDDVPLILALSKPLTVYAFDDFVGHEKGVRNINRLLPQLQGYVLIDPPLHVMDLVSATTIALLVPEALL